MIAERRKVNRKFTPGMNEDKRQELYDNWKKAVKRAMHWEEEK
jgi:glycerol kinase